jgi:cytochrome c biogenesis protein CcdA/thiol-disulfide isomerase/thioredoxin
MRPVTRVNYSEVPSVVHRVLSSGLIGFAGGVITGLSPCILPVLPVIFLSGRGRVVAGLVTSFSLLTLAGAALIAALPIPPGAIRWAGLVALVVLGLGLIVPRIEAILEAPFSRLPQRAPGQDRGGFVLGLVLGTVYVPCAGPVLAAITVAGATGQVGWDTLALTGGFAAGTALSLTIFAFAGKAMTKRVAAFRRRQRGIRIASGVAVILLAVGLSFNVIGSVQRAVPDYTTALSHTVEKLVSAGPHTDSTASPALGSCVGTALYSLPTGEAQDCGPAPEPTGISHWINTPGDRPLTIAGQKGKVVLVDFWTWDCINCKHVQPHLNDWYAKYHDEGLEIIGVHSPEYSFERDYDGVVKAVAHESIKYPVAIDNDYQTWSAYGSQAWPSLYVVDGAGVVRSVTIGEGGYDETETLIRSLLPERM